MGFDMRTLEKGAIYSDKWKIQSDKL